MNLAVGLRQHIAVRHIEAEVAICIIADNQIGRTVVRNSGIAVISGNRCCRSQIRGTSVNRQIPVSSLDILADFGSQTLQPNLLAVSNRNLGRIGCRGCDGVENFVGLLNSQRIQCSVTELSKDIAHQHVELAVNLDHTVQVILKVSCLSQIAEVCSNDIIRIISGAVKLGCKDHLVVFNHQIDYQTALGQIEGIRDSVTGCCVSGLGVFAYRYGFDGNRNSRCVFSCHRTVNGQIGHTVLIDAAGTEHQDTGAHIRIGNIALNLEMSRIVDLAARECGSVRIGEDFHAGGNLLNCLILGKSAVTTVGNIVVCAVIQAIGIAAVLNISILFELMSCFVGHVVQEHIIGLGIVVQPGTGAFGVSAQREVSRSFHLFTCVVLHENDLQERCKIGFDDFLARVFKLCIGRLAVRIRGRSLQVVLAVALDHNRHTAVSNNRNFLLGHFTVCAGSGCRLGIDLIRAVAVLEDDVIGVIAVVVLVFLESFIDHFFRNQTNRTVGLDLSHDIGNAIERIAVGARNLGALIEDDILCAGAQIQLQCAAIVEDGIHSIAIAHLRHKYQLAVKVLAVIQFAVLVIFVNHDRIRLTVYRKCVPLTGCVILHGQSRVCRLENGIIHAHGIAVHGDATKLIAGVQCILLQPVNANEVLLLSVSPGAFCQSEVIAIVGADGQSLAILVQTVSVLIVGIHFGNHFGIDGGTENTGAKCVQEQFLGFSQIACGCACGVAHTGNFHQRDRIAAILHLQDRITGCIDGDGCGITCAGKVLKLEDHIRSLSCLIDVVSILSGFSVRIGTLNGQVGIVVVGSAGQILEVVLHSGIILDRNGRTQRIQFHRVAGGIVEQEVVDLTFRVVQTLESGFQTGEVIAGHGAAIAVQRQRRNIPFHNGFHIGRIHIVCGCAAGQDAAVRALGAGDSEPDVCKEAAVYEELCGIHNGEQHVKGSIGIH